MTTWALHTSGAWSLLGSSDWYLGGRGWEGGILREGFPREVNLRREKRWVRYVIMGPEKPLGQEKPETLPWQAGSSPSSHLTQSLD